MRKAGYHRDTAADGLFLRLLPLLPVLLFFLQGCVLEDMDDCSWYEFTIKVVGADGRELPLTTLDTVNMYLFSKNGFERMVWPGSNSGFTFGYDKNETITLVAWGNLKNDSIVVPALSVGESLDEVLVKLKKAENYDLGAPDLFYSLCTVRGGAVIPEQNESGINSKASAGVSGGAITMSMERAVTALTVTGKYVKERFGTDTSGYRFVVRGPDNALNFLGNPSGDPAYYLPGTFMDASEQLVTPVIRLLPTTSDKVIRIDLYRGDTLLYSTSTDSNGDKLRAIAGKQLNIVLDFRYSFVRVTVTVTPWGEVTQDTGL